MWLDSYLNFNAHISKRLNKAKIAKSKIYRINKIYRLPSTIVKQIQVAAIQLIALYNAEI